MWYKTRGSLQKRWQGRGGEHKEKKDVHGAPAPAMMDYIPSFKDANRKEGKNRLSYDRERDELVPFYYFVRTHQQVTFTDNNEPSLSHQLIKPTLNSLISKVTSASINLRPRD